MTKSTEITDLYTACSIVEGFCNYEPTEKEVLEAWSFITRTEAWRTLQGWYGRSIQQLVDNEFMTWEGKILKETI